MPYIVTGGTGFVGKHLVDRLLKRTEQVFILVRPQSRSALTRLIEKRWPAHAHLVMPLEGDILSPSCGLDQDTRAALRDKIRGIFHLAAVYDMGVTADLAWSANVNGTHHVVDLANELGCRLHHVSSIAITGGVYDGVFREDMFDEGQKLEHPYYSSKFHAEALVRSKARVPFRIYRPGVVVGDSRTGEADKIDGPYYAFEMLRRARSLPAWFPLVGMQGGILNIVPVDYVADALDALGHAEGLDGRCFHLVGPSAPTLMEAMQEFAKAARAPAFSIILPPRASGALLSAQHRLLEVIPAPARQRWIFDRLRVPEAVLDSPRWKTRFDTSQAEGLLRPLGIECPPLSLYAKPVWDYWERHLARPHPRSRASHGRAGRGGIRGKRVLVTGASSGIGRAVALKVAREGGIPLLVARSVDKLESLRAQIEADGGSARVYGCDLSQSVEIDALLEKLLDEPPVDVLVNNAGRSIRRSLYHSYDRLHDFERTMQLNYLGALRLTLGVLSRMRDARAGHVINISSAGVQIGTPRFSAYLASKAAFDTFSRVAAAESLGDCIHFSTIYMPLVRTPMIEPTKGYRAAPALTPEHAAGVVYKAMLGRPVRVMDPLAALMHAFHDFSPDLTLRILSIGYRLTPGGAGGGKNGSRTRRSHGSSGGSRPLATWHGYRRHLPS